MATRVTDDQRMGPYIFGHHGAGSDKAIFTKREPAQYGRIGADGGAFSHQG